MMTIKRIIEVDTATFIRICKAKSVADMQGVDIVNGLNSIKNSKPYEDRQQGEWSLSGFNGEGRNYYNCSVCGRLIEATRDELIKFPYCHCGADMRGGKKNDN